MKLKNKHGRIHLEGYVMLAPAYLIYTFFVLIPLVFTIITSFTNYDLYSKYDFIGLKNYQLLLADRIFIKSVGNTAIYALSLIPTITIALFIANMLSRNSVFTPIFRTVNYLPNVASMVSISMIWLYIFEPTNGLLNQILGLFGVPPSQWLADPKKALASIVIIGIWRSVGYSMVIYLSNITGIPRELYEAAGLDGANAWKKFLHITWPLLQPTTFFLFITGFIGCFSMFEQVNIMTSGGPINSTTTIVHQIFRRAFQDYRMGYASAIAVNLLVVTFLMTILSFKFGNRTIDTGT